MYCFRPKHVKFCTESSFAAWLTFLRLWSWSLSGFLAFPCLSLWQQYCASPCSSLCSGTSTSFSPNWAGWLSRRCGGIWPPNSLSSLTMSWFVYQCPPAFDENFVSALCSIHHPPHLMGPPENRGPGARGFLSSSWRKAANLQ